MTEQAPIEEFISNRIVAMAAQRGVDKTICPSEVARDLFPSDWRNHMDDVRKAAITLQQKGRVMILQKGEPADLEHLKGPVRIKICEA